MPRRLVGHVERTPRARRGAQAGQGCSGVALGQQDRAVGRGGLRGQHLRARRARDGGQLVGGGAGLGQGAGRPEDVHRGGEERGAVGRGLPLLERSADGGRGGVGVAPRQVEQRQPGHGLVAVAVGPAVPVRRGVELAAEAVELGLLVLGQPERGMGWVGQPQTGRFHRRGGGRPVARRLLQLGPVHQALSPVRDQIDLGVAPGLQRIGPLGGPRQVEHLHALEDDGAVHDARGDGPGLAGGHRHHDLVQPSGAGGGVTEGEQSLAVAEGAERTQIGIADPLADLGGADRHGARRGGIAGLQRAEQTRDQQVAGGRHLGVEARHDRLRPAEPPGGRRALPAEQEAERQPERAERGPLEIAAIDVEVVGGLPRGHALVVLADHVGGDRQPLAVGGTAFPRRAGREVVIRVRPGATLDGVRGAVGPAGHATSVAQPGRAVVRPRGWTSARAGPWCWPGAWPGP